MNIKRYDIFPVNHQSGNEIESAGGRYVRFADAEQLQQRLTVADDRVDVLDGLLNLAQGHIGDASLSRDIDAALKPAEVPQ